MARFNTNVVLTDVYLTDDEFDQDEHDENIDLYQFEGEVFDSDFEILEI
ncbi:hypothetical protein [Sphingobacterium sp. NPDC055431]